MATLSTYPPTERAQATLATIPGIRLTEGAVLGVDGPEGHLGPEAAGCVMVLHSTLADPDGAARFWDVSADVVAAAAEAPGLIRFIGFDDGLSGYGVGWWRTEEDARAFARGQAHRDAVREQYRTGFEYTQFAGLWGPMVVGHRDVYWERCGARTRMPAEAYSAYGNEVVDVFKLQAEEIKPQADEMRTDA
jgi:heme-degrading monooxygenase HmoA